MEAFRPPYGKHAVAVALDRTGLLERDLAWRGRRRVVAVHYHATPEAFGRDLEGHLAFFRDRFVCLGEDELLSFLMGTLRLPRPGLVVCFDDGLASHVTVAAPRLEAAGLRGWFMVPGAFLDAAAVDQPSFFRSRIDPRSSLQDGEMAAMTWEDARALAERGHVIGCHGWSHRPLGSSTPVDVIAEEVTLARERLEGRLTRRVRTFCWPRGRVGDHSRAAHLAVSRAFEFAFTSMAHATRPGAEPHGLHRFHLEPWFSLPLVRFQISRLNEAWFFGRRRAVDAVLAPERPFVPRT